MFDQRRPWVALTAAALSLSLGTGLLVFALESRGIDVLPSELGGAQVPEARLPQAPWKMRISAIGLGVAGRKARHRVKEQRSHLRQVVKEIYESVLFPEERSGRIITRRFLPGAARSWMRANIGLPKDAVLNKSLSRVARIGIYGSGAQAAARVRLVMRAIVRGRRIRVVHLSTLWMARRQGTWKVIGFEVDQRRTA